MQIQHETDKFKNLTEDIHNHRCESYYNDLDDDVLFSDKVLGDIKAYIGIILFTTVRFYNLMENINDQEIVS